jgi:hypothetical protein
MFQPLASHHKANFIYISLVLKVHVYGVQWRSYTLYLLSLCKSNWPDDGSIEPKHVVGCTLTKYMLLFVFDGVYLVI